MAGHTGLVGSSIMQALAQRGYGDVVTRIHAELDLTDARATEIFFAEARPRYVVMAAAKVGGILANNTYPADFIRENLAIQSNVIEASRQSGVDRLLFLGSSCIYPKLCPQPIKEEYLLTGPLEPTNRPYALAKIAGVETCWSYNRQYGTRYIAAMPTNLYGPGDHFQLANSHVLAALIRKAADARRTGADTLSVWGTGAPRRELLYSADMADACLFLLELEEEAYSTLLSNNEPPLINIGTGTDISIRDLAAMVCRVLCFDGALVFDPSKPDGTPRKLLDVSRMQALGWAATTALDEGIALTYKAVRHLLEPPESSS